jgi:large subunit ribosomal protein L3
MKFIIGQKEKMTQVFDGQGRVFPVTVVKVGPVKVTAVRTKEKDGYDAIQVQYGKNTKREFVSEPGTGNSELKFGDEVKVGAFAEGEGVVISGTSKGRGFQGVVKRHGFHGGPRTHGQKHSEREPGAIGGGGGRAGGRVAKGIRMAGRQGNDRVTLKTVKVIKVDAEEGKLYLSGSIPGRRGSLLTITAK